MAEDGQTDRQTDEKPEHILHFCLYTLEPALPQRPCLGLNCGDSFIFVVFIFNLDVVGVNLSL